MINNLTAAWVWRKSKESSSTNNCVKAGSNADNGIAALGDTKNPDPAAILTGCDVRMMIRMVAADQIS